MRSQDRIGQFYLRQRAGRCFEICWPNGSASTGTSDPDEARKALTKHALEHDASIGLQNKNDPLLAEVFTHYKTKRGNLASIQTFDDAARDVLIECGRVTVSQFDIPMQLRLVEALRKRGLADSTIQRKFNAMGPAFKRAWKDKLITSEQIPPGIWKVDWAPVIQTHGNDRVLDLDEIARLFNTVPELRDADHTDRSTRYATEHWWRFLVLAFGTGGRPGALLNLHWSQLDLERGTLDLNEPGRQQTNKYRALVRLPETVVREIRLWEHTNETFVLDYYRAQLATTQFFDNLLKAAGITDVTPKTIRHTVRTWFADNDADDKRVDLFMGHARPDTDGSRTGARYIHRKPSYLKTEADILDKLFQALSPLVLRSLGGFKMEEQPSPDDWDVSQMERVIGIEPTTFALATRRSTAELHPRT